MISIGIIDDEQVYLDKIKEQVKEEAERIKLIFQA